MTYAYDDIVTAKDIRTGKVRKEDIIGKKGWFTNNPYHLKGAIEEGDMDILVSGVVSDIPEDNPGFADENTLFPWNFFIPDKEEDDYIPFDLNSEEVRKSLKGRWIESTDGEYQISGFHSFDGEDGTEWMVATADRYISPEVLLSLWKFDDGTPCGKLKED